MGLLGLVTPLRGATAGFGVWSGGRRGFFSKLRPPFCCGAGRFFRGKGMGLGVSPALFFLVPPAAVAVAESGLFLSMVR